MAAPAFTFLFNQVTAVIEDAFFDQVADRMSVLQAKVNAEVKKMFSDIADSFGQEQAPAEIGENWAPLTTKWIDEKKSGENRFYVGKTGKLREHLKSRSTNFVYGVPQITLGTTVGRGFSNASGRTRIAKGFAGAGRFASAVSALRATIVIVPFPKLANDGYDPTDPFGVKVGAGEYGVPGRKRPARPFLGPFIKYYTDKKIPDIINQVIR